MTATGWLKSSVPAAPLSTEHPGGIPQVHVQVGGGALRCAFQQGPALGQHHLVVVGVDHPALRRHRLGHLVGVVHRRQPGADIQELPDPRLTRQETNGPAQERPVARTSDRIDGRTEITCSAACRSAGKLSVPPSQ